MTPIGIVGEHDPANETHAATDAALRHAAGVAGLDVGTTWVSTADIPDDGGGLDRFAGLFISPGGPYRRVTGALAAIGHARRAGVPLLGTCAGFQHVIIEYARSVVGVADAAHAEYDPGASTLFVTPLTCVVAGRTLDVNLRTGSRAAAAYGGLTAHERYYCRFGLNPAHRDALVAAGLRVSGTDETGEVRIVELADHPFFVATLFVPQVASTPERPHPLVASFVRAAVAAAALSRSAPGGV
jgi:CTP synthase (UTP-ammonia lyase)